MRKFLGPQVPIERSFFRVPRLAALIGGFWPEMPRTWYTVLYFWVNTTAVLLGAGGEMLYGFLNLQDLFSALEAFCPGVTKVISLLKMLTYFTQHRRWQCLVQRLRVLLLQDSNPEKRRIVEKLSSMGNILSFILLCSGSVTNAFFNILPLLKNAYRLWQGLETEHFLPFNVIIPQMFIYYPYYPFTYCALTLSGAMTVFTFSAVDGFFLCACLYTCGLFRLLEHDLRDIFAVLKESEFSTAAQNAVIRRKLRAIVVRHNEIFDLSSDIRDAFIVIVMMHFLSAALVLCLSIVDMLLSSASVGVIVYIFYSIAALMQLLLYCIGGTYVGESSLAVSDTLYELEWYKCDVKTRKMILIMLFRAQRAKTVAVPFFAPSLPAFRSIISTAGSYIAVFKTFI